MLISNDDDGDIEQVYILLYMLKTAGVYRYYLPRYMSWVNITAVTLPSWR